MRFSALAFAFALVACGAPQREIVDYRPTRVPLTTSRPTGPTLGGFRLGERFLDATRRCESRGRRLAMDFPGSAATCSGSAMPVGYPVESVFLRKCGGSLCQITVRIRVEGETQLQHGLADLRETWTDSYGPDFVSTSEADPECEAGLAVGQYGCLLRGVGRFVLTWEIESLSGARAQLTGFGAAGTQSAVIRLTIATEAGIAASRERDL
ncbi:MAG: hypothetical protein M3Y87_10520 [Myxococcota bacterium]|nr:hypothetical protein [Myxococcota bacterium]